MTRVLCTEPDEVVEVVVPSDDEELVDEETREVEDCEVVELWLELVDADEEVVNEDEEAEDAEVEVVGTEVEDVVLVTVAKYKPTPATTKIITIMTTTIDLEIACSLFLSDIVCEELGLQGGIKI
jgi:hypothetical protein